MYITSILEDAKIIQISRLLLKKSHENLEKSRLELSQKILVKKYSTRAGGVDNKKRKPDFAAYSRLNLTIILCNRIERSS